MTRNKFVIASAALAMLIAAGSQATARPGEKKAHPSNHGATVSAAARNKGGSSNHGSTVSATARNKSKTDSTYSTHRRDDYTARPTSLKQATEIRDQAIRDAQRRYKDQRKAILNDGDTNDKVTKAQKQELERILRERNAAVRAAQEQFRAAKRALENR